MISVEDLAILQDWAPFQYKDGLPKYEDSHYKDEMVMRLSYFYNGNPHTGKTESLYFDSL